MTYPCISCKVHAVVKQKGTCHLCRKGMNLINKFDGAARLDEMRGSYPLEERGDIAVYYNLTKKELKEFLRELIQGVSR